MCMHRQGSPSHAVSASCAPRTRVPRATHKQSDESPQATASGVSRATLKGNTHTWMSRRPRDQAFLCLCPSHPAPT